MSLVYTKTRGGQLAALRARTQANLFPIEPDLNKINKPTLIIWGKDDRLIPVAAGHKMNSLINNSTLLIFDKCGHLPQEEIPDRVVGAIEDFVSVGSSARQPRAGASPPSRP